MCRDGSGKGVIHQRGCHFDRLPRHNQESIFKYEKRDEGVEFLLKCDELPVKWTRSTERKSQYISSPPISPSLTGRPENGWDTTHQNHDSIDTLSLATRFGRAPGKPHYPGILANAMNPTPWEID